MNKITQNFTFKCILMALAMYLPQSLSAHCQVPCWVANKEKHAQNIIATISDYFLTQRVKASQKDYSDRLVKHHTVIVAAMKAKQNSDAKYAGELKKAVEALLAYYPAPAHKH